MNESTQSPQVWDELVSSLTKRGVVINLVFPFVLFGIGYLLRASEVIPDVQRLDDQTHQILFYALGGVALGELIVAAILRKALLHPSRFAARISRPAGGAPSFALFSAGCMQSMTVIFAVGACPAVYGFVLYALGGTIEQFVFFLLIALLGYRLLRPHRGQVEELWEAITFQHRS